MLGTMEVIRSFLFRTTFSRLVVNASCIHRVVYHGTNLASSPGHSQILSRIHGEKSEEGLGSKLHHRPEMVYSVST